MPTLTTATRAQLQATSDTHGFLELVMLEHASWASPVRLVNDTRDWTIGGQLYTALPFRVKVPSQVQGENPRATLQIDNVGRELTALIEALPVGATLTATLRQASRSAPADVIDRFVLPLSGITVNALTVSATIGLDQTMRQSAVRLRFDPATTPGLFPG